MNIFKALRDEEFTLTWSGVGVIRRLRLYEAQSPESSIEPFKFVRYFMGALLRDAPQFEDEFNDASRAVSLSPN